MAQQSIAALRISPEQLEQIVAGITSLTNDAYILLPFADGLRNIGPLERQVHVLYLDRPGGGIVQQTQNAPDQERTFTCSCRFQRGKQ